MSTLDRPICSRYSIVLTCPVRPHFQRTQSRERWGQGWDERYRSSREGEEWGDEDDKRKEEERKQATNFKEAVFRSSAVVQEQHCEKMKGSPRVTGTLKKANSHFDPTQTGSGTAPPRCGGCWLLQHFRPRHQHWPSINALKWFFLLHPWSNLQAKEFIKQLFSFLYH